MMLQAITPSLFGIAADGVRIWTYNGLFYVDDPANSKLKQIVASPATPPATPDILKAYQPIAPEVKISYPADWSPGFAANINEYIPLIKKFWPLAVGAILVFALAR